IGRVRIAHPVEYLFGEISRILKITQAPVVLPIAGAIENAIRRMLDKPVQQSTHHPVAPCTSPPAADFLEQAMIVALISSTFMIAPARLKAATATRSLSNTKKPT